MDFYALTKFFKNPLLLVEGDADADALKTVEESPMFRPQVELDPNNTLFNTANTALENSEEIAGSLFNAEGGSCSNGATFVGTQSEKFCEEGPVQTRLTCRIKRIVEFDRYDRYKCAIKQNVFVQNCKASSSYSCISNYQACVARNFRISYHPYNAGYYSQRVKIKVCLGDRFRITSDNIYKRIYVYDLQNCGQWRWCWKTVNLGSLLTGESYTSAALSKRTRCFTKDIATPRTSKGHSASNYSHSVKGYCCDQYRQTINKNGSCS